MGTLSLPPRAVLTVASCLALAACAVGPDYREPAPPPATATYGTDATAPASSLSAGRHADGVTLVAGMDVPAAWWATFHCQELSALVERALVRNPNIDAAKAALRAAHELVVAQWGAYYPSVTASVQPSRQGASKSLASPLQSGNTVYNLTTTQLSVSYVPDLFGANQRMVESLVAQEDQNRFELEGARLTLAGSVVLSAIQEVLLRELIAETEVVVHDQQRIYDSYAKQRQLGQASPADMAAQDAALAQAQAALPPLAKQQRINRDLLAALLGISPGEVPEVRFAFKDLILPANLPLSVPAQLVEHRPDVRIAEAQLHAACAQVGVAAAARWPQIDIGVVAGSAALALTPRFSSVADFWGIAATLTQPIFAGGALEHRQRAAEALFDQAKAQYQATVVGAMQSTADALHALWTDAESLRTAVDAENAVSRSLDIARRQLTLGDVTPLIVFTDEQALDQARLVLLQARVNRYADVVALFQALGGGWWNRSDNKDGHDGPDATNASVDLGTHRAAPAPGDPGAQSPAPAPAAAGGVTP
jgi:NodT family efflux transporter outer membrane factor (OMF) lipoprotein